jgi:hypothetical protein
MAYGYNVGTLADLANRKSGPRLIDDDARAAERAASIGTGNQIRLAQLAATLRKQERATRGRSTTNRSKSPAAPAAASAASPAVQLAQQLAATQAMQTEQIQAADRSQAVAGNQAMARLAEQLAANRAMQTERLQAGDRSQGAQLANRLQLQQGEAAGRAADRSQVAQIDTDRRKKSAALALALFNAAPGRKLKLDTAGAAAQV